MLRLLALQSFRWELTIISQSATRNNSIETSVVEEVRRTVQRISDVRGASRALENVTRCLVAATNAIILLPAANLTRSVPTGRLDKIPDIVTNSTATVFRKYSVRNSGCSNVLGHSENIENNGAWYMVYQERRWRQFCDRNTFRGSPGMASPVLQSDKQT